MAGAKIPKITVDSSGHVTGAVEEDVFFAPHDLLGADHSDTQAASPTRGDIVIATSIPKWAPLAIGADKKYLRSDGTDPGWSALLIGDLPAGGTWALTSDLDVSSGGKNLLFNADGCRVKDSNAAQAIANAVWTTLTWDTDVFDASGMHDPVTNNSRITAGRAGRYLVCAGTEFAVNSTGARFVRLIKNGSEIAMFNTGAFATYNVRLNVTTITTLTVGQYVEVQVFQNSGAPLNVVANSSASFFTAHQLSQ